MPKKSEKRKLSKQQKDVAKGAESVGKEIIHTTEQVGKDVKKGAEKLEEKGKKRKE